MPPYLLQRPPHGHSCCLLYAICNSLRYFGREDSPEPGSAEWERLVNFARCRHGSALRPHLIAEYLGLMMEPVDPERCLEFAPVILSVWNPSSGSSLHSTLAVGADGQRVRLVNYRTPEGPVVEDVQWESILMPNKGNVNRKAWLMTLLQK